jgi:hypothetical protein
MLIYTPLEFNIEFVISPEAESLHAWCDVGLSSRTGGVCRFTGHWTL